MTRFAHAKRGERGRPANGGTVPTSQIFKIGRGSSVVERRTENPCVGSSILPLGTINYETHLLQ